MQIEPLREEDYLKIGHLPGRSDRLVVSMSGVGRRRNRMPPFEFVASASNGHDNHVLLVSDRTRSWMNRRTVSEAIVEQVEALKDRHGIKSVVTLGNSMGGFMALVLPQLTPVDRVIAISPQYSMHPGQVPEEKRWQFWRDRFPHYAHETVGRLDNPAGNVLILHGDSREERIHWSRFPRRKDVQHFILRGMGHDLARDLQKRGILKRIVRNGIVGRSRRVHAILAQHYNVARREELALQKT